MGHDIPNTIVNQLFRLEVGMTVLRTRWATFIFAVLLTGCGVFGINSGGQNITFESITFQGKTFPDPPHYQPNDAVGAEVWMGAIAGVPSNTRMSVNFSGWSERLQGAAWRFEDSFGQVSSPFLGNGGTARERFPYGLVHLVPGQYRLAVDPRYCRFASGEPCAMSGPLTPDYYPYDVFSASGDP